MIETPPGPGFCSWTTKQPHVYILYTMYVNSPVCYRIDNIPPLCWLYNHSNKQYHWVDFYQHRANCEKLGPQTKIHSLGFWPIFPVSSCFHLNALTGFSDIPLTNRQMNTKQLLGRRLKNWQKNPKENAAKNRKPTIPCVQTSAAASEQSHRYWVETAGSLSYKAVTLDLLAAVGVKGWWYWCGVRLGPKQTTYPELTCKVWTVSEV